MQGTGKGRDIFIFWRISLNKWWCGNQWHQRNWFQKCWIRPYNCTEQCELSNKPRSSHRKHSYCLCWNLPNLGSVEIITICSCVRLFVFKHIWLRSHPLCSFYCETAFLCVLFNFLGQSLMYKVNGGRRYLRVLCHWCEKSNWGGITLSKALDVMHISPCLAAKEGDCSEHKHLKSAGNHVCLIVVLSTDSSASCHEP